MTKPPDRQHDQRPKVIACWCSGTDYEYGRPHGDTTSAGGGEEVEKTPTVSLSESTGLSFSCTDLVDPKRDFLLTLNESAQSRIAACIRSPPPPPPPHLKNNWADWGERDDLGACITGVIVIIFFLQEGGVGGCPSPPYLANSSKTEVQL